MCTSRSSSTISTIKASSSLGASASSVTLVTQMINYIMVTPFSTLIWWDKSIATQAFQLVRWELNGTESVSLKKKYIYIYIMAGI